MGGDLDHNFDPRHITGDTFQALLDYYPATVEAVTRRKATDRVISSKAKGAKRARQAPASEPGTPEIDDKQKAQVESEVEAYRALDAFRYEELPGVVQGRASEGGVFLEKEEVVRLVEWKLKHGIFRPTLLGMVKKNQGETVRKSTSDAFAIALAGQDAGFPKTALENLVKPLRGVGVATASLLLSVGTSCGPGREEPFYSDDSYLWVCMREFPRPRTQLGQDSEECEKREVRKRAAKFRRPNGELNVKYDLAEYKMLWTAVTDLRTRLNGSGAGEAVSCADVEKVAYVLRYIDVSGYLEEHELENQGLIPADEDVREAKANPNIKRKRYEGEKVKGEWDVKKKKT
ncbi:hypothetical protein BDV23DRAFT_188828 [Aspergillus alliaceus]|uniref:Uncharacterized protein n=1 Tax=Petromyces alliaceus TaxID=209559 RepID=A0A5N7BSY6_PETAA|nr:hypothetical protein BDV23DRAFT_188828 [Aspergillus alliaceus]